MSNTFIATVAVAGDGAEALAEQLTSKEKLCFNYQSGDYLRIEADRVELRAEMLRPADYPETLEALSKANPDYAFSVEVLHIQGEEAWRWEIRNGVCLNEDYEELTGRFYGPAIPEEDLPKLQPLGKEEQAEAMKEFISALENE